MKADDSESFTKHRRNFLAISVALIFVKLAELTITSARYSDVTAVIGKPERVYWMLWAMWVYWVWRYCQQFKKLNGWQAVKESVRGQIQHRVLTMAYDQRQRRYDGKSPQAEFDIKRLSLLQCAVEYKVTYSPAVGTPPDAKRETEMLGAWSSMRAGIAGRLTAIFVDTPFADYLVPLLVGAATVVYWIGFA